MAHKDIERRREYRREWYARNGAKERQRKYQRKTEIRTWFHNYKLNMKCEVCGYTKCVEALQFHHIDPTNKDSSLSVAVKDGWSRQRIIKEIEKCVVLCANCHFEYHAGVV